MSAESRRLLHALLERTGARLDEIDSRLQWVERVMFQLDDIDARLARLEERPPRPLGGRELQRQRVQAVLRVRAQGYSHARTAAAVGISKAGVRRILILRATLRLHPCVASTASAMHRTGRRMGPGARRAELGECRRVSCTGEALPTSAV
jgi:hypothetical protein